MSDPTIRNLLRRAARASPQWHDEELNREFPEHRDRLLSSVLIRPIAPRTFAECPHCGGGVPGRVRPILNPKTAATGLWLSCATCGLVEVRSDSLRRWMLDIPGFAASIATAARVQGQPQPFADDSQVDDLLVHRREVVAGGMVRVRVAPSERSRGEPVAKPRTCLKCGETFDSSGPWNRICARCHRSNARIRIDESELQRQRGLKRHNGEILPNDLEALS